MTCDRHLFFARRSDAEIGFAWFPRLNVFYGIVDKESANADDLPVALTH
jgi:hypothetical protein